MQPTVFLGPSLDRAQAQRLLEADYRPPVKRGDLSAIRDAGVVVIVDGEFRQNFSVSPKEILALLDDGVTVVGAASMGALRAVELARYGMIGIGWVYEAYRSGLIIGDDEVALTFSPIDGAASTVPLVNVRQWLDRMETAAIVNDREKRHLLRRFRQIHYTERTPDSLTNGLRVALGDMRYRQVAETGLGVIPDVKAADARLALRQVANWQCSSHCERS